jgi:hypothetical protein
MKLLLASHMRLSEYGNKYIRLFKKAQNSYLAIIPELNQYQSLLLDTTRQALPTSHLLNLCCQASLLNPQESFRAIDLTSVEYIFSVPETVACH